jgi:signal transduction histidine kinase
VRGDAIALRRLFTNLVENALRYGTSAAVTLESGGAEVVVTVDDDGPGIPPEDFERVFEPFVRLEGSRSAETGGLGLGLAIARSIVRGHGGEISLANRTEGGLRVQVRLPLG